MQPDPDPLPPLETTIARWIASNAGYDALRKQLAPYDADRQRLREAIAAKDRAFCTAPLHGLKPEFFAFCEIEGESPEIQFFESAEEASKAADAFLERAQDLLADGLTEEPEIAYGRIYARCETHRGPSPEDADYDETWSMEMISRLTAEAENERLRARVAELEAEVNSQRARDQALAAGEYQLRVTRLEDRLAKYDALAVDTVRLIHGSKLDRLACMILAQKVAQMAPEVT